MMFPSKSSCTRPFARASMKALMFYSPNGNSFAKKISVLAHMITSTADALIKFKTQRNALFKVTAVLHVTCRL